MQPLLTPVVNERGDEVNARFVTHYPTFLQSASASQTVGSELLQVRTHFVIKSNVDLSQTFHVVYIHAHHVAQSVRHEHGMCSCADSFFCVALHQSDAFQSFGHPFAHVHVYVPPFDVGSRQAQHIIVAVFNNAVDFTLFLGELSTDGSGSCMVTAIILIGFRSGVTE